MRPSRTTRSPSLKTRCAKRNIFAKIFAQANKRRRPRAAPSPRWPRSFRPSSFAGAARVMVAISLKVYSRVMEGSVVMATASCGIRASGFGARVAAHDECENLRIGREGRAVRMVGREENPPWIVDQQETIQGRRPIARHWRNRSRDRGRARCRRHCRRRHGSPIFLASRMRGAAELAQHVGRNRDGLPEHHLADIDGDIWRRR